jgi:hypothetical protein
MRKNNYLFLIIFPLLIIAGCKNEKKIPVEVKELPGYPSASGVEYFRDKFYIIGDDANNLIILDTALNITDSIQLFSFPDKRIPKTVKADLESMTITPDKRLLLLGSGSLAPYRNTGWFISPATKQKDSIRFSSFLASIPAWTNIKEVNVEGAVYIKKELVIASRGNKSYPKNHLLFVSQNYPDPQVHGVRSILLGYSDSLSFQGVSGLAYSAQSDALICTVSTEDTRNSLDDGAIGKSYLWIIKNISSKRRWKAINPDKIIDLEAIDPRFRGHKIESVCVINESKGSYQVLLAADNDNGSSTLFKLTVPGK